MMQSMYLFMVIMTIFDDFTDPISDTFHQIFGSELLLGIFVFIIIMILVFIFGLGFIVGSVVFIPAMFLVFGFIPSGRIILAIILGLFVGLGLHRLMRR